jgi:hypothetical protein
MIGLEEAFPETLTGGVPDHSPSMLIQLTPDFIASTMALPYLFF